MGNRAFAAVAAAPAGTYARTDCRAADTFIVAVVGPLREATVAAAGAVVARSPRSTRGAGDTIAAITTKQFTINQLIIVSIAVYQQHVGGSTLAGIGTVGSGGRSHSHPQPDERPVVGAHRAEGNLLVVVEHRLEGIHRDGGGEAVGLPRGGIEAALDGEVAAQVERLAFGIVAGSDTDDGAVVVGEGQCAGNGAERCGGTTIGSIIALWSNIEDLLRKSNATDHHQKY